MSRAYGSPIATPKRKRRRPELGTARWAKVRRAVLARDLHTCHWCGGLAEEVDHVLPAAEGGPAYDLDNLVASCGRDNRNRPPHDSVGCTVCSRWVSAYSGERGPHKASAYSVRSCRFLAGEGVHDAASSSLPPHVVVPDARTTTSSGIRRKTEQERDSVITGDYSSKDALVDNRPHKRVR